MHKIVLYDHRELGQSAEETAAPVVGLELRRIKEVRDIVKDGCAPFLHWKASAYCIAGDRQPLS